MSLPEIASRDDWRAARMALLEREKELTRTKDRLSAERRRLPMVRIEKDYRFDGPATARYGCSTSSRGDASCSCSTSCSTRPGTTAARVARPMPTRSPPACSRTSRPRHDVRGRLTCALREDRGYRRRKGWSFPWYSSAGGDFNYDFHATIDESIAPLEFNYRTRADFEAMTNEAAKWLLTAEQPFELPGLSCFLRDGDSVFHTYSTYGRGTEAIGGAYGFSISPHSAARKRGRSPKAGRPTPAARRPTSRAELRARAAGSSSKHTPGSRARLDSRRRGYGRK